MANKLWARASTRIRASQALVFQAFTDPELIKQYLFGTNASSDWKQGSDITYQGEWEGKKYLDKGKIIAIEPDRLLHTTYFSGMSGKEDKPENYANVIYTAEPAGEETIVTITQDNIDDAAGVKHMEENWNKVLEQMKKVLE
ncbi:MAG: Activator of Hsp90 ATPase 1 family protein [Ferruginibacter sp.]|nr:Activator of Hsp90 ATPase 1 family protein [Ferruginibacter sp.]